jgi:hypothetical protein
MLLYIDPGAGSMLVQAVLAGLLAVPFVLRSQLGRAVERVRDLRRRRGAPAAEE